MYLTHQNNLILLFLLITNVGTPPFFIYLLLKSTFLILHSHYQTEPGSSPVDSPVTQPLLSFNSHCHHARSCSHYLSTRPIGITVSDFPHLWALPVLIVPEYYF